MTKLQYSSIRSKYQRQLGLFFTFRAASVVADADPSDMHDFECVEYAQADPAALRKGSYPQGPCADRAPQAEKYRTLAAGRHPFLNPSNARAMMMALAKVAFAPCLNRQVRIKLIEASSRAGSAVRFLAFSAKSCGRIFGSAPRWRRLQPPCHHQWNRQP